jgi:hypothetical protein
MRRSAVLSLPLQLGFPVISTIVQNVVMLNVIMLNVVMLNVVAPSE